MKTMNRNAESHFSLVPTITAERSTFDLSRGHSTTFDVGELVPLFCEEILPGDTFNCTTSKVVRLQTPITPFFGNIYLDTYWFFVPRRLVWKHWREFMGENTESAWIQSNEYSIPQVEAPVGGWDVGTLADKLGVPTGVSNISVDACYFRGYAKIVDDWFRDQNLQDPVLIPDDDATGLGTNGGDYVTDLALGGKPFTAARYHDYFSSSLPNAQKGAPVAIPVALPELMPVSARAEWIPKDAGGRIYGPESSDGPLTVPYRVPLVWTDTDPNYDGDGTDGGYMYFNGNQFGTAKSGAANPVEVGTYTYRMLTPINLWAESSGNAAAATINQLRMAFQVQRFLERNARSGSRYIEILKAHFNVTSPDARLQRSEYLGGNRVPLTVNQIVQTSETGTTPQGNTAAFSLTTDLHEDFTRSFTEHGILFCLGVVRYDHYYQQGIPRMLSRKTKYDFYWPVFAHLGEQAVLNKEIYAQGTAEDDEVFGYQEHWAEYRYSRDYITGELRSSASNSLDVWHLGDDYSELPVLSADWIKEDKSNVDRVLAVQSSVSNQIIFDGYAKIYATRVMPTFSVPGLIDHY